MTADQLLNLISRGFIVALGVLTALEYFRHPNQIRRDVALLFAVFAIPVGLSLLSASGAVTLPSWALGLSTLSLLFEPLIIIRLLRYLRPVPRWMLPGMLVTTLFLLVLSIVISTSARSVVVGAMYLLLIVANIYALGSFVRGAFSTTGLPRRRLRFIAIGSLVLVIITIALEIQSLLPQLRPAIGLLNHFAIIAGVSAFYLGFAPPRWLRRLWQLNELNEYLSSLSRQSVGERMNVTHAMTELCAVANRAVGGMAACIVQREGTASDWAVVYSIGELPVRFDADGIMDRVRQQNEPGSIHISQHPNTVDRRMLDDIGAETALVAPILSDMRMWGILIVFLRFGSLFIEDDVRLLNILAQQDILALENGLLIQRLKDNSWEVEQSLRLTELLFATSRTLLGARGYEGIVAAVYDYASKHGATVATLSTIEVDENDQPEWANTVARMGSSSTVGAPVGARYRLTDLSYSKFWIAEPDKVQLVENTLTDPRYDDAMKTLIARLGIHANVTMPLATDGGWIGVLGLSWAEPHVFSSLDRQFYNSLAALVTQAMVKEQLRVSEQQALKKLEAANRELEAFSYSVSHDLRSPLRAMDGFSQALQEDYADKLDADGRNYLNRIRASSQRMGNLIDDLLELSRLSRTVFKSEQVDLTAMAKRIADELRESEPERNVVFEVEEGMIAKGDARLLQVVMTNLLSNAWKYTGKQPSPCIEFGVKDQDGKRVYCVCDNGAGFDMTFVNKLFGVFQRLHDAHEFPGNGIGLATVQRIIQRHGGEIWAEGEVNKGATFYFTLN